MIVLLDAVPLKGSNDDVRGAIGPGTGPRRWLFGISMAACLTCCGQALAQNVVDPCNNNVPIVVNPSPKCIVSFGGVGQTSTDSVSSISAFNYGQTDIAEIWDMSNAPQGVNKQWVGVSIDSVSASPQWSITQATATLRLTGLVDIDDPDATLDLTLTGTIGSTDLVIDEELTRANCGQQCNLASIPGTYISQLVAPGAMSESLDISSEGRVYYNAGDPDPFTAPEPASLGLLGGATLGLIALRGGLHRRRPMVFPA